MPPERRVFASPPRSPEMAAISLYPFSSSTTSAPTAQDTLPIPTYIPDASCMSMPSSSMGSKVQQQQQQQKRATAKRQNSSQTHESQPRHQHLTRKQHRRLQDAHEEYHRQREVFQAQQQQQQQQRQEQQQEHHYRHQRQTPIDQASYQEEQHQQHQQCMYLSQSSQSQSQSSGSASSSSGQYSPYAAPFEPSQRFANNRSDLSRSSSSSSLYHPSVLDTDSTETTTKPRSRRSSPGLSDHHHHHHPPRRRGPYSTWTAIREKERTRLLTNLSTLRESLQTVPLPSQVARENLGRLHQRIQHRRARARETILYDLHQGVKVVEAQVHRQVEMVLSRLKEAPASKYAFALTNSFLSQVIPHTGSVTGSLLAQAANGLFQTDLSYSSSFAQHQQQQQQQQQEARTRSEADALTNDFGSIALAGQLGTDRPSALAGLGDPNGLSTKVPGVAAACTQILSAALPSFIPSMVAPLVCVFSYQTPAISDLAPIPYTPFPRPDACTSSSAGESSLSSSSIKKVEEPTRKEFVYPWGHPNEPYPPPPPPTATTNSQPPQPTTPTPIATISTPATSPSSLQSLSSFPSSPTPSSSTTTGNPRKLPSPHTPSTTPAGPHPDSGIVVVHSKSWTQHEREALYLAATRFRLSGQWSKIREMMNLHRTDMEIKTEYKKLYAHRELDDHHLLLSDDEDDHYEARTSIIDAITHNSEGEEEEGADDETETMIFMKFGGSQSAHHKRQQLQHLQSRRLHYDMLHLQLHPPIPQQELQHHHQPKQESYYQQQQQQQHYLGNGAFNVPPLHDNNTHYQQQQQRQQQQLQQQQQRLSSDPDPIRIFKKEFMIDKRFILEEIPMRI